MLHTEESSGPQIVAVAQFIRKPNPSELKFKQEKGEKETNRTVSLGLNAKHP